MHVTFILYYYIIMISSQETVHLNSLASDNSHIESIVRKTDTEFSRVFDNEVKMSSPDFIIKEIKKLNPDVEFEIDLDRSTIYSPVNVGELELPEWFYYDQKNRITNKNNTQSGISGSIYVYPIEYSDQYGIYY